MDAVVATIVAGGQARFQKKEVNKNKLMTIR
jgi:hypothetical protein